ncbi:MAG: four helix bundle protein [Candidatus Bipolaricaulia bacterium]
MAERFEDLRAWKTARTLANEVYAVTKWQPFENDWSLKDQIRRAAISVMSNAPSSLNGSHRAGIAPRQPHATPVISTGGAEPPRLRRGQACPESLR